MNENKYSGTPGRDGDDSGVRLIRLAGPRQEIDHERYLRIHEAVHTRWQSRGGGQRRVVWRSAMALAAVASIVAVISLSLKITDHVSGERGLVSSAHVELMTGEFWQLVQEPSGRRISLSEGDSLKVGQTVATVQGRAAIRLAEGRSIRLDRDSRVKLVSAAGLILERGAVYVDSVAVTDPSGSITVQTQFAKITEIGTQFEVRLVDEGVRVRVREGLVVLQHGKGRDELEAGRQARLNMGGELLVDDLPRYGPEWDWVAEVTPAYRLEGRTLLQYLSWLGREVGCEIVDPEGHLQGHGANVTLHGQLPVLRPLETAEIVLQSCGLKVDHRDGVLVIRADRE